MTRPLFRLSTWLLSFSLPFLSLVLASGGSVSPTSEQPVFTGADGQRFPAGSLLGRPRILHFFTGQCTSCQRDDRLLRELAFEYADQGVVLLNVFRNRALRSQSVNEETLILGVPEVIDISGNLTAAYQVGTRSETVFVNRQGRVVARLSGRIMTTAVLKALRGMLNTSSF